MRDVEHIRAVFDPDHAVNQGSIVALRDGRLMLGFNQERGRVHSDSGQSCVTFSSDGAATSAREDGGGCARVHIPDSFG